MRRLGSLMVFVAANLTSNEVFTQLILLKYFLIFQQYGKITACMPLR